MVHNVGKYTVLLIPYFLCIGFWYPILAENVVERMNIWATGKVGEKATINCTVSPENVTIEWMFQGRSLIMSDRINLTTHVKLLSRKDVDGNEIKSRISTLTVLNTTSDDAGNYTCIAKFKDIEENKSIMLDLSFPGRLLNITEGPIKRNKTDRANVTLRCLFEVYKPGEVKWYKINTGEKSVPLESKQKMLNARQLESTVNVHITNTDNENANYTCEIEDTVKSINISGTVEILVYGAPTLFLNRVVAINTSQVFFNWTIKLYNCPVKNYALYTREKDAETFRLHNLEKIGPKNTSFIINELKNSTTYVIRLDVTTTCGEGRSRESEIRTLDEVPVFVPNISINGFSATSVTIGWTPPPENIEHLIHYYVLEARKKDENVTRRAYHSRDGNLPYMFDNLEPHSTYIFQACAGSDFTGKCGEWSQKMEAATLDGIPGRPSEVRVTCTSNSMHLNWGPPEKPNAEIKGYTMELTGNATYRDHNGDIKFTTWGPLSKFMANDSRSVKFNDLQPNTNYTIRLSAMTRTRRRGDEETRYCETAWAPPDHAPRPRWRKIYENETYFFKVYLPRISERNGPLCCYRVYLVRLRPGMDYYQLPPPSDIETITYDDAHTDLGAYITDVFSNDRFPATSEFVMGDKNSLYDTQDPVFDRDECRRCVKKPRRLVEVPPTVGPTELFTPGDQVDLNTEDPVEETTVTNVRRRRYVESDYSKNQMMMDKPKPLIIREDDELAVFDGLLDTEANYTLFIELITGLSDEEPLYSEYVNPLRAASTPPVPAPSSPLEIILQVACAAAAIVLLTTIVFCLMQTRGSRKPPHAHLEMNPIQVAFRYIAGRRGRQQLMPTVPPDMPPIAKEDLASAYAERQANSDYDFQKEFELLQMLPECYSDRTTHASEARENQPKNRYPDIKAYDQTRVKLAQIDSVTGSDYINANYVMGYQERKQFICAQGPTETTVNDFWRMIWEHGLELIVMLTNLEEYSKVKCSKYWPDEIKGTRAFGNITVHHVGEKRYSDYIVRELKISKQATNAEGQPIVENNGISKRNGDCKDTSESSAPTSPREYKDTSETRTVRQYHFLMWKDFAAPEHPHSILKFIKRVNEAWTNMVGRPVVVHCSAGVGRTGTLVALDCMLDELRDTGHVTVFNTVAELRRQRNFLVQSLKQYVFVYRALVEYAHYGDTEIPASRLKATIDRLRNMPEGADKCLMEHDFEKILNSPVSEVVKSCAVGGGEELRPRNRSPDCLPYDRNRVILTPIPTREFSTYINASFIEAYDNSEGFIITQDPLPNTIMDFWRMVLEHNVTTIIMLSELGEGKCPRYWEDGSAQYEHLSVQYEESESCPYYTRRQFRLVNNKSGEVSCVRQLQYQGWPTAPGHVPEVTRGLAELADAADPLHAHAHHAPHVSHAHHSHLASLAHQGTLLVHCQYGTERSSLFVALCILICQLRVERRVDVSCVARKVRSQRARTIDTFLQYEFLHRAILNYAELHNLLEDS